MVQGYGQKMAPGRHHLNMVYADRTFFRRQYLEEWLCAGCGVRFFIRCKSSPVVIEYANWIRSLHKDVLSDRVVMLNAQRIMRDSRARIVHTKQGSIQTEEKIKVRIDFSRWKKARLVRALQGDGEIE